MNLSVAEFLTAGADLGAAMASVGVGPEEAREMTCAFAGMAGEVLGRAAP